MRGSITAAIAATLALPPVASARAAEPEPTRIEPKPLAGKERRKERRMRDESHGGTENGTFEFVLGGIAAAVTATVIGRGIWELVQIRETERDCRNGAVELACSSPNAARGNQIAAGLSFGLAVPLSVATGFLFARGVRTRRDYQAWHAQHPQVSLLPSAGRRGGGLALHVRF